VSARERALAFLRETYRCRADRVERRAWGELVVSPTLPLVYDANFAVVDRWDGDAAQLWREMERAQRALAHRKVVLHDEDLAARLGPGIATLDVEFHSRYLIMAQQRPPDRAADPAVEVVGIGDADWADGRAALLEEAGHGSDPELVRQLLELDRRLARTLEARHLAAVVEGEVASYAALYRSGAVAQIEDVATLPEQRGRGLARAVVLHAAAVARREGAELVFLVADEADWPQRLYRRLGFEPIGVETVFGRPARHHSHA